MPGGGVELRDKEDHHAFVEGGAVHVDGRTQRESEGAGFVGDFGALFNGLNGEGEGRGGTGSGKSGQEDGRHLAEVGDGVDPPEEAQGEPQAKDEVNCEGEQDGEEKEGNGTEEIRKGCVQEHRGHESKDANGNEADNEIGEVQHDRLGTVPELRLRLAQFGREHPDEGSEENGKGNDAEELSVIGGGLYDIGGEHPQEDIEEVAGVTALDFLKEAFAFGGGTGLSEQGGGGFAIDPPGADEIDEEQAHENGGGTAEAVIHKGLKAHATHALVGPEVHHARDDGRHNERHDQHLEGVHEEAAHEIADLLDGGGGGGIEIWEEPAPEEEGEEEGGQDLPMERPAKGIGFHKTARF